MSVMTSEILQFLDFIKTQKSKYLLNETLFFLQKKKLLITHQGLLYGEKYFCSEGNLKLLFFHFQVTDSNSKNTKLHFEILTRS